MPRFLKFGRPRGTVHNLATALSLKDQGCNILILSDAALYVLQNLVALDIEFKSRWMDQVFEFGYYPIEDTSANYGAWVDLIEQIQSEVIDMSCDLVAVLEEIRDQLTATNTKLDSLIEETGNLVTAEESDDTLIDDLEPIFDAINVILGGTAVLGA